MQWFRRRRQPTTARRRFSDLMALSPEQRHAVFASADRAEWIDTAARYGLVEAQVLLAQIHLDRGDSELALRWFRAAAGAGHAPAVNMVGRCLENGWGTSPNPAEAARHYRTAAEQGLDWGQFNLANMLLYGLGIARDRVSAFEWYGRAARQGHAKAMNMLARFHEEGWDRPRNPDEAVYWYRRSAEGGDYRGQFNLGTVLSQQGRGSEALAWFEAAIAVGDPDFLTEASAKLIGSADPAHRALGQRALALIRNARGEVCLPRTAGGCTVPVGQGEAVTWKHSTVPDQRRPSPGHS